MVRRLKSDLRRLSKSFPERVVEPIVLRGLPGDAPELKLAEKTLAKHRTTLASAVEDRCSIIEEAARAFAKQRQELEEVVDADEEERLERLIEHDDDEAVEQATRFGMQDIEQQTLARELAAVDAMLDVAGKAAAGHDARIRWLLGWVRDHCLDGEQWNDCHLILFTLPSSRTRGDGLSAASSLVSPGPTTWAVTNVHCQLVTPLKMPSRSTG